MKRLIALFICFLLAIPSLSAKAISVSAHSAIVIDGISGKVLYGVNERQRLSMASTTKIMTALILCEQNDLQKNVTVTEEMINVEGSSMGLAVGVKVTFNDLLYGMLLSSGNDAANATAIAIGGSLKGFVAIMNKRAEELGLKDTHFDTPSGLDGPTHYTTAYDLSLLTKEALKNEDFAKAAQTSSITLNYGGMKRTLHNHNRLLSSYDGAVGVKTGFTKKSGRCLVSAAKRDNGFIIAVTLNDGNDWQDHVKMLDYGFGCLESSEQSFEAKTYKVAVHGGTIDYVTAVSSKVAFRPVKGESVTVKEYIFPYVSAPVKEGEKIGYLEYYCGGTLVAKQPLKADINVKAQPAAGFFYSLVAAFKKILKYI